MASAGVKQSATKEEFKKALGLNKLNPNDNAIMDEMRKEVASYWNRHVNATNKKRILKPEFARNDKIQPPYKWAHLDPAFIDSSIKAILDAAKPGPRQYYNLGVSEDEKVLNWVLKWQLYQVCRHRDPRNKKGKPPSLDVKPVPTTIGAAPEIETIPPKIWLETVLNRNS